MHDAPSVSTETTTSPDSSPGPSTEIGIRKTQAFVLRESDFERFEEVALRVVPKPLEVEAKFSDGVTRKFSSVSDLMSYKGPADAKLKEVSLMASLYRPNTLRFSLSLGGDPNVSAMIEADESAREQAVRDILSVLSNAKPWYQWLSNWSDWTILFLAFFVALMSVIVPLVMLVTSDPKNPTTQTQVAFLQKWSPWQAVFPIAIAAVGFPLNRLRRLLFPGTVFLIGAAERSYQRLEIWRQIVVGAVIALICGLVVEFWLHR
jgi:hypothetical protein